MSDMLKRLLAQLEKADKSYSDKSEAYQKKLDAYEARLDADGNIQALSAEEKAELEKLDSELDVLQKEITRINGNIEREKSVATARGNSAVTTRDATGTVQTFVRSALPAAPKADLSVTEKIGLFIQAAVFHKANPGINFFDHVTNRGYEKFANEWHSSLEGAKKDKFLSGLTDAAGKYNIPTVLSSEFIPWLYPRSIFISSNPERIDLSAGNLKIPGGNASASASYRAEGSEIAHSQATFREVPLTAKNLSALTSITNELINRAPAAVDSFVRTNLAGAYTEAMDLAGLRGATGGDNPVGVRYATAAGNIKTAATGAAPTVATIESELNKIWNVWVVNNLPIIRPRVLMSPRTFLYLQTIRDGNGNYAFPTLHDAIPTLRGVPVSTSTQIPVNLGTGTDESELYLVDFGHVYFGDTQQMSLLVSQEASFNISGTQYNAFQRNLTLIRLIGSHDVAMRYDTGAAILTGVEWGYVA